MTAVDPHHHFWMHGDSHQDWRRPEHRALERDFQPADLHPELRRVGVDRTVLVQSVNTPLENDRLIAYAERTDFVAGVVAWLPLSDPATARMMLDRLRAEPAVRGIRCLIGRDDLDWLATPAVTALLGCIADAGWAWDVVPVTARQVTALLDAIDRVPHLRVIIDHLGRPPVESGDSTQWARHMDALAAAPTVAVKVSVGIDALSVWPQWNAAELQRYVDHAVERFGPHRLMLASNWPVVELRTGYATAWTDLERALVAAGVGGGGRSEDLAAVRGGTAAAWYRLEDRAGSVS